jgi:hypothetical protein
MGGAESGIQLGVFGEATLGYIPPSLQSTYGTDVAVTLNVGVHVDSELRRMHHGM